MPGLTIAIPTYGREAILLASIDALLRSVPLGTELIVIDQTPKHRAETDECLRSWDERGQIRLIKRSSPSIPQAMNHALLAASSNVVMFLDDDIEPEPGLVEAHLEARDQTGAAVIAGRVIQPWQEGLDFSGRADLEFAGLRAGPVEYFMGGNFSIRRDRALELGGFDENFVGAAYNFEREFAFRVRRAGHQIHFEPRACIHHLKASSGGTRKYGHHLTTVSAAHTVGAYYSVLRTQGVRQGMASIVRRPFRSVATRHHLRRPWWIPLTILSELRGMAWAFRLAAAGPKYVASATLNGGEQDA